jgi:hypothetical protein
MNFMNEWEIEDAVLQFRDDRILGAAAQTLSNLCELANTNSDGWAYWPKPARAANKLMCLLQGAMNRREPLKVTSAQVRGAYSPIKAFLTRENLTCVLVDPR